VCHLTNRPIGWRPTRRNHHPPIESAGDVLAYNRAGQILSEDSQISGDPTNGTTTYTYDPLERLTAFTRASTTTTYGWDDVPNRTSVQVGAGAAVTTSFDAANRPTSDSAGGAYTSDLDGRLTARPSQRFEWDNLSRLTKVKPPTGGSTIADYSYDPLDRLRLVDYGGSNRIRFRYVGLTTSVAQVIDDQTGSVLRNVGTGWGGERLLDWTGTNSNIRYYGTNAHHDVTWTGSSTGTVSATLRYDPWGNLTASTGSSLPDFRFQNSWFDSTTDLSWVVTRWYAPSLGRFISEDSLLGAPLDPPSRHLYAYGGGEPIGRWDSDGRFWYRVKTHESMKIIARRYYGSYGRWPTVWNGNRNRIRASYTSLSGGLTLPTNLCIWLRRLGDPPVIYPNQCVPVSTVITGKRTDYAGVASARLGVDWYNLTIHQLLAVTDKEVGRVRSPNGFDTWWYWKNTIDFEAIASSVILAGGGYASGKTANMLLVVGNDILPGASDATTIGHTVFIRLREVHNRALLGHEYIHTLQEENGGWATAATYHWFAIQEGTGPSNHNEAIAYLWQEWVGVYPRQSRSPWCYYRPLFGPTPADCG
jgi:RHS repeat-associated protein